MKIKLVRSSNIIYFLCFLFIIFSSTGWTQDNEICMECHSDSTLEKELEDGTIQSMYVNEDLFKHSIHGEFACTDCHTDLEGFEDFPHDENLERPDCETCHDDVKEIYSQGIHGKKYLAGDPDAPYCWDCHTSHYVFPTDDSLSSMFIINQPDVCGKCHSDPELVRKHYIPISQPSELYKNSIHYKAAEEKGKLDAAKCSDCHRAHDLQPSNDPRSLTNKFNIPNTCSTCHPKIYQEYMESVHGKSLLAGATDAPVCTDCHTEHTIKAHTDPTSTVFSSVISKTTCPQCHEAVRIVSKYGLKKKAVESYNDSYHGLANRAGAIVTANCSSCHGVHDIRPSYDPKSLIHKDNLPKTCGKCHPGVTDKVTIGSVHLAPSPTSEKIVFYVRMIYLFLIVGVIGGMLFHNGIDFLHKLRNKFKHPSQHEHFETSLQKEYVRLSLNERIQHFILMGTFTILVVTGFALKFPEAWWAAPFTRLEGAFEVRGLLHRIAGGLMIVLALYHVFYIFTTRRGKRHIKEMIPSFKDAKDAIQMIKFNLGLAKEKPKFDYYNYIEKAEYWALIWGTFIMGLTGFILWFENISLRYFPKWVTDVSTVIHYYEAVLATLAILVWHFYYQFFDPHIYPMNTTCLTGKMTEEEMKEEHPLALEKLEKEATQSKSHF